MRGIGAGDDPAVRIGQHQIAVDAIKPVDGGKPVASDVERLWLAAFERLPEGYIGGPPAHIGGALVKIADDQLDKGLRQIGEASAFHLLDQRAGHGAA